MAARSRFGTSRAVRVAAVVAALLLEGALIWALVSGLAARWSGKPPAASAPVTVVNVPMPTPTPQPTATEAAGLAAPPAPRTPAAAMPSPAVPLATPSPAVTAAGAAQSGAGSGAGGDGSGTGAGGDGSGTGGGLSALPVRIAGALSDRDYPRTAGRPGGTVGISFQVAADGSVNRCAVIASSGAPLLDELTCRLVVQRFRYRPARDAAGRPVASTLRTSFTWGTR